MRKCGVFLLTLILVLLLAFPAFAGKLTYSAAGSLLDHVLKTTTYTPVATLYVGLSTADPLQDGSGWADPTYTGYARKAITFAAAGSRSIAQTGAVTFDQCTNGSSTVTHWGIWTLSTGGVLLAEGALSAQKTIVTGNTPSIATGQVTISFDAGAVFTGLANSMLDFMFRNQALSQPTNVKLALSTTTPQDDATGITEPSGNNYSQLNCNAWDAAAGTPRLADNTSDATFATPSGSWGTVTYGVIYLDTTPAFYASVTSQAIGSGDTVKYLAGAWDVSIN